MLDIMQRGTRSASVSPQQKRMMSGSKSTAIFKPHTPSLPGGGVPFQNPQNGFENDPHRQSQQHLSSFMSQVSSPTRVGSLNYFKRKKDINAINNNNKQLLKAIQQARPVVSRDGFRHHEKRIKKLKQHISTVRYGSLNNFMYPQVDQENHNYHSSQFVFTKNPSNLNIIKTPSSTRHQKSYSNLTKTYGAHLTNYFFTDQRPQTSSGYNRKRMRNSATHQSVDFIQGVRVGTPNQPQRININNSVRILVDNSHDRSGIMGNSGLDRQFDNILNQKMKLKQNRKNKSLNKSQQIISDAVVSSDIQKSPQQFQRKVKSRQQRKSISQSSQQPFAKKPLEIESNFNMTQIVQHQTPSEISSNPYFQTSAVREKFVKPQTAKNQQPQYLDNRQINIITHPQKSYLDQQPPPPLQETPDRKSRNQPIQDESSIKFIQPKIQINKVDDEDQLSSQQFQSHDMNNDLFTNSHGQQSPQFVNNQNLNLSPTFNQQKISFESHSSPPQSNKLVDDIKQQQMLSTNAQQAKGGGFMRTNTRYCLPVDDDQKQSNKVPSLQISKVNTSSPKPDLQKSNNVVTAIQKEQQRKARIEQKVRTFIQNIKQKVQQKRQINSQQHKKAQNFFVHLFGMASQIQKEDESLSVKYSDESFEEEKQAQKQDSLKIKKKEEEILQKGAKVMKLIQDAKLQKKVEQLTLQFIQILRDKAVETKQKNVMKALFAKKFAKQPEQQTPALQSPDKQRQMAQTFISNIQPKQRKNVPKEFIRKIKQNTKSIQQSYQDLPDVSKQIINSFFKYLWRQAKLRKMEREFIANLKAQVENKKKLKQNENLKMFQGFASKFMMISGNESAIQERDSISIHYSDEEEIESPKGLHSGNEEEVKEIAEQFVTKILQNSKPDPILRQTTKINSHALNFIDQGTRLRKRKEYAQQVVKRYVQGLRQRIAQKKQKAQAVLKAMQTKTEKKNNMAMRFIQNSKQKVAIAKPHINVMQIKDDEFQRAIKHEFRRLFARLFQLNSTQRQSRIYMLYFAYEFRQRALLLLRKAYKKRKQRPDEEQVLYKHVESYIYLNELRLKYQTQKGLMKAKEYIYRLKYKSEQSKGFRIMIQFHLNHKQQSPQDKCQALKRIIAMQFQCHTYKQHQVYNPFRCNNLTVTQVKLFIANLFQNTRDLVGRPINIFRLKNPTKRQVRRYLALQFQRKQHLRQVNIAGEIMKMVNQRLMLDDEEEEKIERIDESMSIHSYSDDQEPQQQQHPGQQKAMEFIKNLEVTKFKRTKQAKQFIGVLKEKRHETKINTHTKEFIEKMQTNNNNMKEKTDENVKKFVGIFKKNYGRGKVIEEDEDHLK